MLADPAFCELAYVIGVASLAADDAQIWHLTKLYWRARSQKLLSQVAGGGPHVCWPVPVPVQPSYTSQYVLS